MAEVQGSRLPGCGSYPPVPPNNRNTHLSPTCRSMNEPWSQYKDYFSQAVAPANRSAFINNIFAFLDKWGFDG